MFLERLEWFSRVQHFASRSKKSGSVRGQVLAGDGLWNSAGTGLCRALAVGPRLRSEAIRLQALGACICTNSRYEHMRDLLGSRLPLIPHSISSTVVDSYRSLLLSARTSARWTNLDAQQKEAEARG